MISDGSPFLPAEVSESDIDNIGEPLCADAPTVIEYTLQSGDQIRVEKEGSMWYGKKSNVLRSVIYRLECEFGSLDNEKTDSLITAILDVMEVKYTRTETEEGLTL